MFNWLKKKISRGNNSEINVDDFIKNDVKSCEKCKNNLPCSIHLNGKYIDEINCYDHLKEYNPNFRTILLIDDNSSVINFLRKDIEFLEEKGLIENLNIIKFDQATAVFELEIFVKNNKNIVFDYAIIDITYGGKRTLTSNETILYTGIDALNIIQKNSPNCKYMFLTGNNMSVSLKNNKIMIDKFNKNNSNINFEDVILFKTSVDMDDRRKEILTRLFNVE
jgi:CheY-like chemotaxis protein